MMTLFSSSLAASAFFLFPFLICRVTMKKTIPAEGHGEASAPGRPGSAFGTAGHGALTAEQQNANQDDGGGPGAHVATAGGCRVTVAQRGAVADPHWVGEQERRCVFTRFQRRWRQRRFRVRRLNSREAKELSASEQQQERKASCAGGVWARSGPGRLTGDGGTLFT